VLPGSNVERGFRLSGTAADGHGDHERWTSRVQVSDGQSRRRWSQVTTSRESDTRETIEREKVCTDWKEDPDEKLNGKRREQGKSRVSALTLRWRTWSRPEDDLEGHSLYGLPF
jgi:hypothetical protein